MSVPEIVLTVSLSLLGLTVILALLWLFLSLPRVPTRLPKKYKYVRFAHRGLHTEGVMENSLTAFMRAANAGYGIELDVRLCKSGELVVCHDESILRVTGVDKRVVDLTLNELSRYKLSGTEDTVPAFREVLRLIDGRVPLLVEIKSSLEDTGVAERFLEEIADYSGEYIVESFNPKVLRTVRRARPDIPLGILSLQYTKEEKFKGKPIYFLGEKLKLNFFARPDFIAYDHTGYGVRALRLLRKIFKVPTFAWTVKSQEEERLARAHGFDTVIFEQYIPKDE